MAAPLPSAVCFLLTNLIYIGLAMSWGFSISRRILHCDDRRWLLLGCTMTVLWLFLRAVKYRFFSDDTVTRYLWYLYYVPQILAPLFSLYAALQLGRREGDKFSPRWYLLLVPAALLIGGVLTNDWHQLAFRAAPGAATLEADYTHGWVYFAAMAWMITLLLATGILVYCKCRISKSRQYAWALLCAFVGGFALCALSFANIYTFHKMPECFCLTFAAFWESCLQVGLLPTNGHYRYFFAESTVAAQIVEGQGQPVYRAKNAPALTAKQLNAAAHAAILLDADTRLQSAPVQDGRVYWVEDISKINRIREQLADINAQLSEENELIRAENALKRQRAQIEEKNRLMDAMLSLVQPQLLAINRLLADESATLDSYQGVWAAVKVTADGATIPADITEMAGDTLTVHGKTCDITFSGTLIDGLACHMEGSALIFSLMDSDAIATLRTDGTLALDMLGMTAWYERTGDTPAELPTEAPIEAAADVVGQKFVIVSYEAAGQTYAWNPIMGEYAMTLQADGTVSFVIGGNNIPGLVWRMEGQQYIIDSYGTLSPLVMTDAGFDFNYMGMMLMHFAPANS